MIKRVTRRDFLKSTAGVLATMALPGCWVKSPHPEVSAYKRGLLTRTYSDWELAALGQVSPVGKIVSAARIDRQADRLTSLFSAQLTYIKKDSNGELLIGSVGHGTDKISSEDLRNPNIDIEYYLAYVAGVAPGDKNKNLLVFANFGSPPMATITADTNVGAFGRVLTPYYYDPGIPPLGIGIPQEGKAKIISDIGCKDGQDEFDILITGNYTDPDGYNRAKLEFIDPKMINIVGTQLVHGMSGSPIIQDGKIVAAASHYVYNKYGVIFGSAGRWIADMVNKQNGTLDLERPRRSAMAFVPQTFSEDIYEQVPSLEMVREEEEELLP